MKIFSKRYTVYGKFSKIKSSPACTEKIFNVLNKDDFLPFNIQVFQINKDKDQIVKTLQPGFVNKEKNIEITFMPDKIEITIKNNFSDMLPMVINYINQFSEIFNIKIEAFSLETVLQLRNIDLNLSNSIKNKIIPSNSLFYEADDIVWQVAHKKKIHKQDNDIIMSERINCSEESESLAKIEYDIIMNVKKNKDISNEEHLKELDSMTNTNISDIERVLG